MSNASYAQSRLQSSSPVVELLKEMFSATPLGLVIAVLKSGR
jgi:hypothetical protein